MLGYPIAKPIRKKLDEKIKLSNRDTDVYQPTSADSKNKYLKNISKTSYVAMLSEPKPLATETDKEGFETFTEEDKLYTDPNRPELTNVEPSQESIDQPILISNQEYSNEDTNGVGNKIRFGLDLYNTREGKKLYRPTAGIKSLSSTFESSNNVNFVRNVTINWIVSNLKDLEQLSERFLKLGEKVYVEWGWASPENKTSLISNNGNVLYKDPTQLRNKVIEIGKGEFDAVYGYIDNFSFSAREDGGFDCVTEIRTQGISALEGISNPSSDNTPVEAQKFLTSEQSNLAKVSFETALNNLPETLYDFLIKKQGVKKDIVFNDYKTITGTTTTTDVNTNETETKLIGEKEIDKNFITDEKNIVMFYQLIKDKDAVERANKKMKKPDNIKVLKGELPTFDAEECWIRWGWFEDNILNKFFAIVDPEEERFISLFRSIESNPEYVKQVGSVPNPTLLGNNAIEKFYTIKTDYEEENKPETSSRIDVLRFKKSKQIITLEEQNELNALESVQQESIKYEQASRRELAAAPFVSKTCRSDKNLKTANIKQFIFPGKFTLAPKKIIEFKGPQYLQFTEEKQLLEDLKDYKGDAQTLVNNAGTLERLQQEVSKERDLQQEFDLTSTGIIPYLELRTLESIFKQITPFQKGGNEKVGKIRDIFINVAHLQNMFSQSNATLGENVQTLLNSLAVYTGGLIDLKVVSDTNIEGLLTFQEKGLDAEYEEQINRLSANNAIYEFPVRQQNSIVLSQEISVDLSSEMVKILQSQQYSNQLLEKTGISLTHQANFNQSNESGDVTPTSKTRTTKLKAPFLTKGYENLGNLSGQESINLVREDNIKNDFQFTTPSDEKIKEAITKSKEADTTKDLESASRVFQLVNSNYTIDGVLKPDIYNDMKQQIKFEKVEVQKEQGKKTFIVRPNLSNYGLLGLTNTLKITGIAGIYPSNVFTTNYLPTKFKENAHFYATGVSQDIDESTWTTTIEGRFAWRYRDESNE